MIDKDFFVYELREMIDRIRDYDTRNTLKMMLNYLLQENRHFTEMISGLQNAVIDVYKEGNDEAGICKKKD